MAFSSSNSRVAPMRISVYNVGLCSVVLLLAVAAGSCYGQQLSTSFYTKSCPKLLQAVESVVRQAVGKERRMGASLIRLFFHDCFVNGCDGSILLDDAPSFKGEKTAGPNINSVRGFDVIDRIKSRVEKLCPGVVSCADIVAIAARDSTTILGGPRWKVKVGRRDSKTASISAANSGVLPPPTSTLANLINRFQAKGLSVKDMVALSGAHTVGLAKCAVFRARIYNSSNIHTSFAKSRQQTCPLTSGSGDDNLAPFDPKSSSTFDTNYFKNLLRHKGLLTSDQVLFNGGSTDSLVRAYSRSVEEFHKDFAAAMIKMGYITPLTGSNGEIRSNCRRKN